MGRRTREEESDLESGYSDSEASSDEGSEEVLKNVAASTAGETILLLVSIITVGLSLTAMSLSKNTVVYLSGLFCFLAPYGWKILRSFTEIKAMQETHEAMVAQVNQLGEENDALKANVEELKGSVNKLNDVENALDVITQKQGQGVNQFREQVKKGKQLLKGMKKNLRGTVLQSLLTIVMASDEDGDAMIDDNEADAMIQNLKSLKGITLREDLFREAIRNSGGSLDAVMDMVRDLVKNEDIPPEEQIFLIGE